MWDPALPGTSVKDSTPVAAASHNTQRPPLPPPLPRCFTAFPLLFLLRVPSQAWQETPSSPHSHFIKLHPLSAGPLGTFPLSLNIINNLEWGRAIIKSFVQGGTARLPKGLMEFTVQMIQMFFGFFFLLIFLFNVNLKALWTQPVNALKFGFFLTSLIWVFVSLPSVWWSRRAQRKAFSRRSQTRAAPSEAFEGKMNAVFLPSYSSSSSPNKQLAPNGTNLAVNSTAFLQAETCASRVLPLLSASFTSETFKVLPFRLSR